MLWLARSEENKKQQQHTADIRAMEEIIEAARNEQSVHVGGEEKESDAQFNNNSSNERDDE